MESNEVKYLGAFILENPHKDDLLYGLMLKDSINKSRQIQNTVMNRLQVKKYNDKDLVLPLIRLDVNSFQR